MAGGARRVKAGIGGCNGEGSASVSFTSLVGGYKARVAVVAAGNEGPDAVVAALDADPYVAYRGGAPAHVLRGLVNYQAAAALMVNSSVYAVKGRCGGDCSAKAVKAGITGNVALKAWHSRGIGYYRRLETTPSSLPVYSGYYSHIGPRKANEDSLAAGSVHLCPRVAWLHIGVLADGAGGLSNGQQASMIGVLESLVDLADAALTGRYLRDAVRDAVLRASRKVEEIAKMRSAKMASTLVVYVIDTSKRILYYASVGDSALYLVEKGAVRRLNKLHRTEMGGRQALTSYLGLSEPEVDVDEIGVAGPAAVVAMSDGVHDYVDDNKLAEIVWTSVTPTEAARRLVEEAARRGSRDNMSALVTFINNLGAAGGVGGV